MEASFSAPDRAPSRRYRPMLATLAEALPRGQDWMFEPKWDGYRALAYLRGDQVELVSRTGKSDLGQRFPSVVAALPKATRGRDCVLDGEICALDEAGRPRFSLLQQGKGATVYQVFDLLELEGKPVLERPLWERRRLLERLLDSRSTVVRLTPAFTDGQALLQAAREQGLEGVVAKRRDSRYEERRSSQWLKIKARPQQELVVVGYTKGRGRRAALGALVLAVPGPGGLRWAGNVGTGFTEQEMEELLGRLSPLARPDPPLTHVPRMRVPRRDVVWVEPRVVVEVEHAGWTHDGRLRSPSFLGVREDKPAWQVRREQPLPSLVRAGSATFRLSNLDKLFWPKEGIRKGDLLAYYHDIASVLLPHLRDRPFVMLRYPDGIEGKAFFQRRAPRYLPRWIPTFEYEDSEGQRLRAPVVRDEAALLWMVNMGCIDLHPWCSRVDKPHRPDWVVFDLDPGEGAGMDKVVEVALLVRALLEDLGLRGYPKTSGGDGLHVLVPITRRSTYADARDFASLLAQALATARPHLVSRERRPSRRRGVLVDAAQNGEGRTLASAYSVRPRPGAPVSTPLTWDEVRPGLDPAAFTMEVVRTRVLQRGDLFAPVLSDKQSLAAALRALR
ncbi:MAG: DNA ligase D [Thermoleophilia bacterium]